MGSPVLLDGIGNDNPRQRLWEEAHAQRKRSANNDIDPKDPRQAHVGIVGNPLAHRRANAGPRVGGGDEEGHGLAGAVRVAKQVGDGAGDVAQGDAPRGAAEELEDDEHGQVERLGAANVQDGIDEDGSDVDPFTSANISAQRKRRLAYTDFKPKGTLWNVAPPHGRPTRRLPCDDAQQ